MIKADPDGLTIWRNSVGMFLDVGPDNSLDNVPFRDLARYRSRQVEVRRLAAWLLLDGHDEGAAPIREEVSFADPLLSLEEGPWALRVRYWLPKPWQSFPPEAPMREPEVWGTLEDVEVTRVFHW